MSVERSIRRVFPYLPGVLFLAAIWYILSANQTIDAFIYPRLSYAELLRNSGNLEMIRLDRTTLGNPTGVPVYELLIALIVKVTGIKAAVLAFLPLGGIIVAITYFAISRRLFASNTVALILTLTVSSEISFFSSMYSIGYHVWGFSLYSIALLLFVMLAEKPRKSIVVLLLLSFAAIQYVHPVITIWVLMMPMSFVIFSLFHQKSGHALSTRSGLFVLMSLLIINFTTSNSLTGFIETSKRAGIDLGRFVTTLIDTIISAVTRSGSRGLVHLQESRSTNVGALELAFHFVTVVPVVACLLASLFIRKKGGRAMDKSGGEETHVMTLLVWIGAFTSVITILVYLQTAGYPGTKFNLFFFPIVSTAAVWLITRRSRKLVLLFVLVLLSINLAKLGLSLNGVFTGPVYSSRQESSRWILYSSNKNTTILSDFATCGLLQLSWSTLGDNPSNTRSITSRIYDCLNNSDYSSPESSFIRTSYTLLAIDKKTLRNSFYADNWQLAPPFGSLLENKTFDKIHDGEIIVFVIINNTR